VTRGSSPTGRGFGWRTIAGRHGLCERQCRVIWAERRSGGVDLLAGDPMESLHEAADQLDALIEDCAALAEATANDSVRVAAIKERRALMSEKIAFQQACGSSRATCGSCTPNSR
jgi:hypothetical protein